MTHDRNYLRMLSDSELIRTAMGSDNDLALVLGERLAMLTDVEDHLDDLKRENAELEAKWIRWMDEAIALNEQLEKAVQ